MSGRFSIEAIFSAQERGLGGAIRKLETGLAKLNATGISSKVTAGFNAMGSAAAKASGAIARAGSDLAKVGVTAGAAALGAGLYSVVKTGADFESAMSSVSAVSGATADEMAALTKRAQVLGSTTKFTATQVTGAMESMVKSGFNVQDTLSGVGGLLAAAAADGGDLGEISAQVMGAMKGLGLASGQMGLFADQLAKAGDATAASIPEITEGLSKFGPVARQLGISTESAIAQISLLRDAGLDASSAGTGLAAIYSKLAAPVGETSKALAKLGITVADTNGNMKAPERLFSEILGATAGIQGNVGKMASMTHLVGLESQKAMLNLAAGAGSGKLDELTKSLQNAAGYADQIAKKRLDNLAGDFTILKAAVDGFQISLFQTQSGPLRGMVKGMTEWISANKGVISSGVTAFIDRATPIVKAFGDAFAQTWPGIKAVFSTLGELSGSSGGWTVTLLETARVLGKITAVAIGAAGIFGGMLLGAFRVASAAVTTLVDAIEWVPTALGKVVFAVTDFVANVGAKWERMKADAGLAGAGMIKQIVFGITSGAPMVIFEAEKLGAATIVAFLKALAKPLQAVDLPGIFGEKIGKALAAALGYSGKAPGAGAAPVDDLSAGLESRFKVPTFDVPTFDASNLTPLVKVPVINSPSLGADTPFARAVERAASPAAGARFAETGASAAQTAPAIASANPVAGSTAAASKAGPPLTEEGIERAMTRALASAKDRAEITVKADLGTDAEVTKQPKGMKISVAKSGVM